jgi:type I restriction enzyme S subunit
MMTMSTIFANTFLPDALIGRFETVATPMAEQVLTLQRQIQNLRRTRDLLLPRLLSGQIEVEVA